MVKKFEDSTFKDNILSNLHNDIEDIINKKMESLQGKSISSLEKVQSIYNDELQTLKKELKYKTQVVVNKLIETIIVKKAVQPNPQAILQFHFKYESIETFKSLEINSTSNDQEDSQQEKNNVSLENNESMKKQLNDAKIKKRRVLPA